MSGRLFDADKRRRGKARESRHLSHRGNPAPAARLHDPDSTCGVFVLIGSQVASKDDAGGIDIGGVVHPFVLKDVAGGVIVDEYQQFSWNCGQLLSHGNTALGVSVVDGVPGFVGLERGRDTPWFQDVQPVPEDEMGGAEDYQKSHGFQASRLSADNDAADGVQTDDAHQHKQARERRDVVELEGWEEVRAESQEDAGNGHPGEAPVAQRRKRKAPSAR